MSDIVENILSFNKTFVSQKNYQSYETDKYPSKKIAILTCMDARLTKLLPAALNLKNGEAKIIKNAGAVISNPFGSVMRSLIVAVYKLEVEDILVIGHHDCGMQGMEAAPLLEEMRQRNVSQQELDLIRFCGIDMDQWLTGFNCIEESVRNTVSVIEHHPMMPADIGVHGFVIHPDTGKLDPIS